MIVLQQPEDLRESLQLLAEHVWRFVDPLQLHEAVAGCQIVDALQDGEHVAAIALELQRGAIGNTANITAAAARPGRLRLVPEILGQLEQLAAPHAQWLTFSTRRPGLVQIARAAGYDVAGWKLRTNLHRTH